MFIRNVILKSEFLIFKNKFLILLFLFENELKNKFCNIKR